MARQPTLKDPQRETRLFQQRCIAVLAAILLLALVLVLRLAYLQIDQQRFYSSLSKQNIMTIIPLPPKRGLIYDRNGVLLAKNIPTFSLAVIPAQVKDVKKTVGALGKIVSLSKEDRKTFYRTLAQYRPFQPVPLKLNLSASELAQFYVNRYKFPGVIVQPTLMRYYPFGEALSNVLGYVGRINQSESRKINNSNYSATDAIGKLGIERYYEKTLHGTTGNEEAEIDATGRILRIVRKTPPTPGDTLYLTIDSDLQVYAQKAFGKESGALVAIQPATGQVLALVTNPSYDPNLFVQGINQKAYQALLRSPEHPLYNRAIRGLFSPGSTIKPFYALAGLNDQVVSTTGSIYDRGYFQLPGTQHIFHDWKRKGHGWVNLNKAIMVSCDTFFYQLATRIGIRRMGDFLSAFGFGQPTGIDMPGELTGLVPTPAWKQKTKGRPWYGGDTIVAGIGQGALLVTPLQLAVATATLAEKGIRYRPHLLLKQIGPDSVETTTKNETLAPVTLQNANAWSVVSNAMQNVVRRPAGTAEWFGRNPPYTIAAKTGTAQIFGHTRDEVGSRMNIPKRLRNNHLFIAYAPVDHPKIALAIVVEHAAFADRLARRVIDHYFSSLKRAQLDKAKSA